MKRSVSILMIVLLLGVPMFTARTAGQEPGETGFASIDAFIEDEMDASRIPGVALAIVEGGQVTHMRGFGDAGSGAEVTPQTLFPIGSLTKSMTALAIMQLVEAGSVDLDAPVRDYLPWFTVADDDAAGRISIRHLLNQTSGLSRQTGIELIVEQGDADLEETVRSLASAELNRPVGERFEYSNANYAVLSLVVQEVSGLPFGDYLREHIFAPLGMTSATTSLAEAEDRNLTDVHRYWFGWPVRSGLSELPGHEPAFVSVEDMATYVTMYLNDGRHGDRQIVSPESIREMLAPATDEVSRTLLGTEFTYQYGMGWFAGPFGGVEDARWHLGELPTFNAWMVLEPEQDRAVVVLTNSGSQMPWPGANEVMSRIPIGVVNLLDGEAPPEGMSLSRFYLVFDLVAVAIVGLQVAALARLALRPLAGRAIAVPLLWEVMLVAGILIGVPALTGMSWPGWFQSVPDLTIVLLAIAGLWLLTAIVRTWRIVRVARLRGVELGAGSRHSSDEGTVAPAG